MGKQKLGASKVIPPKATVIQRGMTPNGPIKANIKNVNVKVGMRPSVAK
jgi:hypothetical protein